MIDKDQSKDTSKANKNQVNFSKSKDFLNCLENLKTRYTNLKPIKDVFKKYALLTLTGNDLLGLVTRKDTLKYGKLYEEANILITDELSDKALRLFFIVARLLRLEKGANVVCLNSKVIQIHNSNCKTKDGFYSRDAFRLAKKELIEHNVMQRREDVGRSWFEVNPNMFYVGDRKKASSDCKVISLMGERRKRKMFF